MDMVSRLEALAASPRHWRVTTRYADGRERVHDTHTAAGAENYAIGERRAIGRDLIDRVTGETVRVVEVTIGRLVH